MKKIIITYLIFAFTNLFYCQQNLVPNPSFENFVYCPITLADLSATSNWNAPTQGSPDYFNSCNVGNASVPNNLFGSQNAYTGSAYVGISVYDTQNSYSYREYLQTQLTKTLNAGQKYWVCFFVSLADTSKFAIKEIGAYFSNTLLNYAMDTTLSFSPQIEFKSSIITDKSSWIKVQGSFIASGLENYIVIGNFNRKQTTTSIQVNNNNSDPYAYYYIDDICVSNDSTLCNQTVDINENDRESFIAVFPNPFSEKVFIKLHEANQSYDLMIYDVLGQTLVDNKKINEKLKEIDVTRFKQNVFYVRIKLQNQVFQYKLIKS